ncbi:MAG: hypothetical protein P9C36_12090 [Defluviicoccus sp.]|nr:hypothetical protein [Defluviicoccus sp.]MDG4593355.1 hypothetical protein [Defluviicoccus sp.]MDS4010308.1 hypothetical protein [Defluviicoccus sp.]MDS4074098.1 hypothetical protein [Defluviicoccus sp.]
MPLRHRHRQLDVSITGAGIDRLLAANGKADHHQCAHSHPDPHPHPAVCSVFRTLTMSAGVNRCSAGHGRHARTADQQTTDYASFSTTTGAPICISDDIVYLNQGRRSSRVSPTPPAELGSALALR